ncbi:MAG: hypothetical protein RR968_00360 [Vagococcus sp.]
MPKELFNQMLRVMSPSLRNIAVIMGIVAILCLVTGGYYWLKKEPFGKKLCFVGCLLLINPIIYWLIA